MAKPSKHYSADWPTRGTPGGWRDVWDAPDLDTETLRLAAAAIRRREAVALARVRADLATSCDAD